MNARNVINRPIAVFLLFTIIIANNMAFGREETAIDKLTVGGAVINCEFADLNHDKKSEALLFFDDESSGELVRKMALYALDKDRFETRPRQVLEIDKSMVCFDIFDIDGDDDLDLLLMSNRGVYAHIYQNGTFSLGLSEIVLNTTIFGAALVENIEQWSFALTVDSVTKNFLIFVPTITGFDLYQQNRGKFELKQAIYYDHLSAVSGKAAYDNKKPLGFRIGNALPAIVISDYNGDKLLDIFVIDGRTICIFKRNFDGRFDKTPAEIFGKNLMTYDERRQGKTAVGYEIYDMNRDGIADIVATKNSGDVTSYRTSVQLFRGRPNGGFNLNAVRQFNVANGASNPFVHDLNLDGRLDLIIPSLKLGFMSTLKILLLKSVEVNIAVYLQNQADEFPDKPDFEKSFSFEADISQSIDYSGILSLDGDYDGDGRNDLLIHEGDGILKIYTNSARGVFEESASREIQILRPDGISVVDLNGDGKDEIIGHYLYNRDNCNAVRVIW
ncbi:MAG: VCBS repeat-containing protein [candidate division Zixibacteria bacterium]|nr:VCBS repeat-containing protein [candidate division Zixibacteria bacterium]